MINTEKVIKKIEEEIHLGEHWDESYRMIDLSLLRDAIALIKDQEEKIRELESMNVTASGNGVAIGSVRGGLVIHKQTAKEIHNIKHVDVLNV